VHGVYYRITGGKRKPFSVETTAPKWIDLWAVGRYDLRLSEDDFWNLSIKEFKALSDRHSNEQDWLNYRGALICATMVNMWRDPKKTKAYKPQDFMPKREAKVQTPEQMLATVKLLNSAYGGKVIEL